MPREHSDVDTRRSGHRTPRTVPLGRFNSQGRDGEIVRNEPRNLAPVITLPVRMHSNRVIEPMDVPPGTPLSAAAGYDPTSYNPGPLARALMAAQAAKTRSPKPHPANTPRLRRT
jgi:hypothetical protein